MFVGTDRNGARISPCSAIALPEQDAPATDWSETRSVYSSPMDTTKVFRNGGSLAVRLPKKYAIPVGDVGIDERDGMIILRPLDDRGWPEDLEERFSVLADLEVPASKKDSRSVTF